ncbi:succinyldiaminopimelate transaminase [uncultured Thiothrix sp.]|uniref:succinyldiaminopimelate transaminase n=1 Tax=uncultured Thiothrix sp. TaxID=223185 RepID=UPI00261E31ED|nr:succinyldiaminopimelate transaminase [uncultured Thiothrix sp.]HMT93840.1 succinyldiaminopimelate transaminase [Thiolinea sp.]
MNSDLNQLHPYPFEKIRSLLKGVIPANQPDISLAIGEPKHPTPEFIYQAVTEHLQGLETYPLTKGDANLRQAISAWLIQRFQLPVDSVDPEQHVLPVNGTREALFAFAQAIVDRKDRPAVLMPNPFYQIYEGAAFLAGAEPVYLNCREEHGFIPDFDVVSPELWERCQLLYICTPGNPTGAVMSIAQLQKLINLAQQYNFVIASDECYSELYFDEAKPPVGLLQAAAQMGNSAYKHCVVFHSLSKRSNAPGMRSGFIAGDAEILAKFLLYRTYQGCAMPPPFQAASIVAWQDEAHVRANRDQYRAKFAAVLEILAPVMDVKKPDAGFYLWPVTPIDDQAFTKELVAWANVHIVPGSYLSRETATGNPGQNRVRMALVATQKECIEAAERIRHVIEQL